MKKTKNKNFPETAELALNITDDSDFLSKYSPSEKPLISSEVAEFLENSAREFHPKSAVNLIITGSCVDDVEKPVYINAIKNYFCLKHTETERDIRRKTFVSLVFTIIGVVALAFMIIYENMFGNEIWTECIDIFAWVFLWEAVDQFFIERSGLLMRRKRLKNFIEMQVQFK